MSNIEQQRLIAAQQMGQIGSMPKGPAIGQTGPTNPPSFYIPDKPGSVAARAVNTVAFTTALGVVCLNAAWGEPVAILIKTAEPRGPPFIPSKIGFRKWHNLKTALSKPLFKNLHSLKIVSVTSISLKLQFINRQFLNIQLSTFAARRIVFSKMQFSTKHFSK